MALTTIKTASLPDDAITSAKIADDAITSALIADDAITSALIADDAITSALLADDAVVAAAIADEAIDEVRLQISNAGTNGQYLQKQSGNTGGLTWADSTGGGGGGATGTDYNDNVKVRFGTGNDLEIYHDGSASYISDVGTHGVFIQSDGPGVYIRGKTGEDSIKAISDGSVELYYDNAKKFETSSGGGTLTGDWICTNDFKLDNSSNAGKDVVWNASNNRLRFEDSVEAAFGDGEDLKIKHDGSHSYIDHSGTGNFYIYGNGTADLVIRADSSKESIKCIHDAAVELYHDGSKRLETTSSGVSFSGDTFMPDGEYAHFGTGNDLYIGHDGSSSYITDSGTGALVIRGSEVHVNSADNSDNCGKFVSDGAAELYYDGAKKLETSADGVKITSTSGNRNLKLSNTGGDYCYMTFMDDDTADDGQVRVGCLNEDLLFLAHAAEKGRFTADGLSVTGHIDVGDNEKIKWGDGGDLEIYHDGNQNLFKSSNGRINFLASETRMESASGAEVCGKFIQDGAAELYFNNVKKFDTKSDGVDVYGQIAHHFDAALVYGHIYHNASATGTCVRFESDGTAVGSIGITATATAYYTSSDYRLKENEVAISDGITRLKTLKPYRFNFKSDPSKTVDGFFAHEVTAVPEAVTGEKDGGDYQEMDYGKITPLLTAALQEAIAKIETLETEVAALKAG